eukprot:2966745-Amphidinium_carterae.3
MMLLPAGGGSPELASKRARSDLGTPRATAVGLSDSAKLDRILLLAEQHTLRLDTQGAALEDLQRRVVALELQPRVAPVAGTPTTSSLPTPPPPCPPLRSTLSLISLQSSTPQSSMRSPSSLPTPPPQWSSMPPRPPAGSKVVTFGSSIVGGSLHSAEQRAGTPGPGSRVASDSTGDPCLLHVTNFPTPKSHQEMVKFCVDTLGVSDTAKVVTRGFFAQRVSL